MARHPRIGPGGRTPREPAPKVNLGQVYTELFDSIEAEHPGLLFQKKRGSEDLTRNASELQMIIRVLVSNKMLDRLEHLERARETINPDIIQLTGILATMFSKDKSVDHKE